MLDANELAQELNLDEDTTTLTALLTHAQAVVDHAVGGTPSTDDLLYKRAVYTVATQLYYDRTLTGGLSVGVKMMIEVLQAKYGGDDDGGNGSTVSNAAQTESTSQSQSNQ